MFHFTGLGEALYSQKVYILFSEFWSCCVEGRWRRNPRSSYDDPT